MSIKAKITLNEHRRLLVGNKECFEEPSELERCFDRWAEHVWPWLKEQLLSKGIKTKKKEKKPTLISMAELVFEAQERKPFFQFNCENDLPLAWNGPARGGFAADFIKYQIGHLEPRNNGGQSNPENLCFMSERCNQHIQSSLPIEEVMSAYFSDNSEVKGRWENLKELHESKEWNDLRSSLLQ